MKSIYLTNQVENGAFNHINYIPIYVFSLGYVPTYDVKKKEIHIKTNTKTLSDLFDSDLYFGMFWDFSEMIYDEIYLFNKRN